MAAELSAIAEDSLSTALEALAAGEPTEADDLATRALTDLNQAVARVRDFKRLRSASPAIELPTVLQTNGGILHAWADLLTLYGVTADASLIRRISEETTLPVAVQRSVEGVTLSVRVPGSETVFDRELAYPFSRIKWSQAIFHLVAQAGQALDAVTPTDRRCDPSKPCSRLPEVPDYGPGLPRLPCPARHQAGQRADRSLLAWAMLSVPPLPDRQRLPGDPHDRLHRQLERRRWSGVDHPLPDAAADLVHEVPPGAPRRRRPLGLPRAVHRDHACGRTARVRWRPDRSRQRPALLEDWPKSTIAR